MFLMFTTIYYLVIFWIITILAILVLWYYPRGFLRKTLLLLPSCMSPTLNDEHYCSEMVLKCEPKSLIICKLLNTFLTEYEALHQTNKNERDQWILDIFFKTSKISSIIIFQTELLMTCLLYSSRIRIYIGTTIKGNKEITLDVDLLTLKD